MLIFYCLINYKIKRIQPITITREWFILAKIYSNIKFFFLLIYYYYYFFPSFHLKTVFTVLTLYTLPSVCRTRRTGKFGVADPSPLFSFLSLSLRTLFSLSSLSLSPPLYTQALYLSLCKSRPSPNTLGLSTFHPLLHRNFCMFPKKTPAAYES